MMDEEDRPKGNVTGGMGIVAGRDASIGDVSGTIIITNNSQVQLIKQNDLEEIRENLLEFQSGIDKLGLKPDDQNIVKGDISSAIKETNEEKPQPLEIKKRFESAIQTIKKAGKTISNVSELYEPAKKIAKIFGIASILI